MSLRSIKNCSKCYIKTIIDPSTYWVIDCNYKKNNDKELKELLMRELLTFKTSQNSSEITKGEVVVIEKNDEVYRGLVKIKLSRSSKTYYFLVLIDFGIIIKTDEKRIRKITNRKLAEFPSRAFKVVLNNIKPYEFEFSENYLLKSVLNEREKVKQWSVASLDFITNTIDLRKPVYIKKIKIKKNFLMGEIYLIRECDKKPKALTQILCDNNFAEYCENNSCYLQDCGSDENEEIPTALRKKLEEFNFNEHNLSKPDSDEELEKFQRSNVTKNNNEKDFCDKKENLTSLSRGKTANAAFSDTQRSSNSYHKISLFNLSMRREKLYSGCEKTDKKLYT